MASAEGLYGRALVRSAAAAESPHLAPCASVQPPLAAACQFGWPQWRRRGARIDRLAALRRAAALAPGRAEVRQQLGRSLLEAEAALLSQQERASIKTVDDSGRLAVARVDPRAKRAELRHGAVVELGEAASILDHHAAARSIMRQIRSGVECGDS